MKAFITAASTILIITGGAKIYSAFGTAGALQNGDPLFGMPFRWLFLLAGGIELFVAFVCCFSRRVDLKIWLLAWLSTVFFIYRLGLAWLGYNGPCSCVGSLTEMLYLRPAFADKVMKTILLFLVLGSYVALANSPLKNFSIGVNKIVWGASE